MCTETKNLGICPVCGKGNIVKGSLGYSCNYFKTMEDKCTFNIYHTYFGKEITEEIAIQLIENKETEVFNELQKKDGSVFSAKFVIEDGVVKPKFSNRILNNKCPACGGNIEVLLSGYACENYMKKTEEGDHVCSLFIPQKIANREIPTQAVELLLQGKETPVMEGFKTKNGEEFSSKLILSKDLNVEFSNNLCQCPKCGGNIYIGKKAYNCSNYRDENIKCDFVVWKEMSGRKISPEEVIELVEKRETGILSGFHDKEGNPMEKKLVMNDDYKIKMV